MANPSDQITDMRAIFEQYREFEVNGHSCWAEVKERAQPAVKVTETQEVVYNLSTVAPNGQKTKPLIYSKTQNRKTKLFGSEVLHYPIIRPVLLTMSVGDVVYVRMEPDEHKEPTRQEEIYLRIEVISANDEVLPFLQRTIQQKTEWVLREKEAGDSLLKAKDFAAARAKYETGFHTFQQLPKKERKTADSALIKAYDSVGLRLAKNYVRCLYHLGQIDDALKKIAYIEKNLTDSDWTIIDIACQLHRKKGDWETLEQLLKKIDLRDKSEFSNWNEQQFIEHKNQFKRPVGDNKVDRLFSKALIASIKNADREKLREQAFSTLSEQGKRMLLEPRVTERTETEYDQILKEVNK